MKAWWQMWEAKFAAKTCNDLIAAGLKIRPTEAVVGFGAGAKTDSEMRRSKIRWPDINQRPWEGMVQRCEAMFHEANRNAFGFDLWELHEVQFTEYNAEDQGHYDWHEDLDWASSALFHRKLSMVVQLSNPLEYEGGELELQHNSPRSGQVAAQGTVVIFPSFHRHRVKPVLGGTRYSLVAWFTGPKFR